MEWEMVAVAGSNRQNCRKNSATAELLVCSVTMLVGCSGVVIEYRTRNLQVAGSTHTRSTASNLEQIANLLCAQANSASYPQREGK